MKSSLVFVGSHRTAEAKRGSRGRFQRKRLLRVSPAACTCSRGASCLERAWRGALLRRLRQRRLTHGLRSGRNGFDDVVIARAAAEIALQLVPDGLLVESAP